MYNLESAINKTDYTIKQLIKLYGNKYDYSLIKNISNTREKITLKCNKHNYIFTKFINLVSPIKNCCPLCHKENNNRTLSTEEFINKANKIHNFKYNYSEVNYKLSSLKVTINCKLHKSFYQTPTSHLSGSGCLICARIAIKQAASENPTGWTTKSWILKAKNSKRFDFFKVYILKCYNNNEEFYKIGRTFVTIKQRFSAKALLPYKYEINKIYEGTAENMFKLEAQLKKENKEYIYLPKIEFKGMYECFSKIKE